MEQKACTKTIKVSLWVTQAHTFYRLTFDI